MDQLIVILPCCALLACYSRRPTQPFETHLLATLVTLAISLPATGCLGMFEVDPFTLLAWLGIQLGAAWASAWLFMRKDAQTHTLPLLTSGLVLLVSLMQLQGQWSFAQAALNSSVAGIVFTGCYAVLNDLSLRLDQSALSPYFQGQPIMLISAGLMGYALFGLAGFGIL